MAPNLFGNSATVLLEASQQGVQQKKSTAEKINTVKSVSHKIQNQQSGYKLRIVWRNVIAFMYLHVAAVYGLSMFFNSSRNLSSIFFIGLGFIGAVGITAGAHRLWAHRCYKAKWPLRLFLMLLQTLAFQNHIYEWVRDHRVHHKFTDTDADPHNAMRGFFFSHMGWLMVRKHPDVLSKGKQIDMSDLESDPIVVFQRRFYIVLMPLLCFFIPTWTAVYFWNEVASVAWYMNIARYTVSLHATWLVNSAAHIWGWKPYDNSISPTDSLQVGLLAIGEGWHNYHHVFPWDYKAAELGNYRANMTTGFIDMCAKLGLAYNLRTVNTELIAKRAGRTGDGSVYPRISEKNEDDHGHSHDGAVWGWDDIDMKPEDRARVRVYNKRD